MKVLAIETSTLTGSIAALEADRVLCELTLHVEETHSAQLMPAIDYVLKTVRWTPNQLDGLGIAVGPGSFTGLRIGLATVKGLATALSKPVAGIPTLEAMAWSFAHCRHLLCPLIDARMKEVYAAWFRPEDSGIARISKEVVISVEDLLKPVAETTLFFGSGAQRYRKEIAEIMGTRARFAVPEMYGARASIVGYLAKEKLLRAETADVDSLEPLYLRKSQAETSSAGRSSA